MRVNIREASTLHLTEDMPSIYRRVTLQIEVRVDRGCKDGELIDIFCDAVRKLSDDGHSS